MSTARAKLLYPWAFEKEPKEEKTTYLTLQEVMNISTFYLKIHSCILYGLLEGELPNAEKCLHYINMGKRHGLVADEDYCPIDFILPENFFIGEDLKEQP